MNKKPLTKQEINSLIKKQKKISLSNEWLDIKNCEGRILAKNIVSKINVPPFNNSAVDGYAVLKKDLIKNKELLCTRRIAAGDNHTIQIKNGEALRIFTGAKMPTNSKTVVMQENVEKKGNKIIIKKTPFFGENYRVKGEDIKSNTIILKKGTKIITNNINLIAAAGIKKVQVVKKIKVGYFTSGNELKKITTKLKGAEINNSNYYSLNSLLKIEFIKKNYCGNLIDNFTLIEKKLLDFSKKFNVIITTGGASVGEEDYLIEVIKKNGKILFWKAAIKPGRPIAMGKINNCYLICLPGNPVSVQLLFAFFVKPFLNYISGGEFLIPLPEKIKVNFNMNKKTKRMEWLRVLKKKNYIDFFVEKFPKQGSGMISSIAYSDGIIEIPENISLVRPGDIYDFYDYKILFY